jgi:hypothetical protein
LAWQLIGWLFAVVFPVLEKFGSAKKADRLSQ